MFNHLQDLTFREAGIGSDLFNTYVEKQLPKLNWIHGYPDEVDLGAMGMERLAAFPEARRRLLVEVLFKQYHAANCIDSTVEESLAQLAKSNTVCVTTGHQLGFAGGPLFLLYKIASVISLARQLTNQNPEIRVVPLFWMNSDDHDLEEVNRFHWQETEWTIPVQGNNGPVGDYLCPEMTEFWERLNLAMPEGKAWEEALFELKKAYQPGVPLGLAFRRLIAQWTKGSGLICLDQQDVDLKRIAWKELSILLENNRWFDALMVTTQEQALAGYGSQVKPMPSLFFYHSMAGRERIEKVGDFYVSMVTKTSWNLSELKGQMEKEPHLFSTNVTGRALYQEFILPNLAYIGGAAEIRYWMQFSGMFRSLNFPFPLLIPRETFLFLGQREIRYLEKTKLNIQDLIGKRDKVFQKWIKEHLDMFADEPWNEALTAESEKWARVFSAADPSLKTAVIAKFAKLKNEMQALNVKRLRAIKQREQGLAFKVEHLYDWIQPKGVLQERIQHPWVLGPDVSHSFQSILSLSNPLKNKVVVLKY